MGCRFGKRVVACRDHSPAAAAIDAARRRRQARIDCSVSLVVGGCLLTRYLHDTFCASAHLVLLLCLRPPERRRGGSTKTTALAAPPAGVGGWVGWLAGRPGCTIPTELVPLTSDAPTSTPNTLPTTCR